MNVYDEIKKEFDKISEKNEFLFFLYRRIISSHYRGATTSQHNRYTFEELRFLLQNINKQDNFLAVPPGDSGNFPAGYQGYIDYAQEFSNKFGKRNSENTIKKNIFPDLERMGFILREKEGRSIISVSITQKGERFLSANEIETKLIFSGAINKISDNWVEYIISIIANSDFDYLTKNEIMFIVSAIGCKYEYSVNQSTAIELIRSYRSLSSKGKKRVVKILEDKMTPSNFHGTKTEKKDFHNWKNKIEQFIHLLKMGLLLEYNEYTERISLRAEIEYNGEHLNVIKKKRSQEEKKNYFQEHNINKLDYIGFELHHIIELSAATTLEELACIDSWKNLIFIDGQSHNRITQSRKELYNFNFNENVIILDDSFGNEQKLVYEQNIAIKKEKLCEIKKYNSALNCSLFD